MQLPHRRLKTVAVWALGLSVVCNGITLARDDREQRWIHEDIEAGYAAARASGKPLLVAFR